MWFYIAIVVFLLIAIRHYWNRVTADFVWDFRRFHYLFLAVGWVLGNILILLFAKDITLETILGGLPFAIAGFVMAALAIEILSNFLLHILLIQNFQSIESDRIKALRWIYKQRAWQLMLSRLRGMKTYEKVSSKYKDLIEAIRESEKDSCG